jgi:PelA/Pel-15E family pectate lyase
MTQLIHDTVNKTKAALAFAACICLSLHAHSQDKVADNMLVYQRSYGGWPKHISNVKIDYTATLFDEQVFDIRADSMRQDCTIDNGATTKEIRYLLKAYKQYKNPKYLAAAEKGIQYLLNAQFANGGWPQFYPDLSLYRHDITYNDNAMVNVLNVLQDLVEQKNNLEVVDVKFIPLAKQAVQKGVDCIIHTQIKVNGKLTGWCAQHDEVTLKPAKARAYEFPSISGSESVGIVEFLMRLPNPTPAMVEAVEGAVDWLKRSAINGYVYKDIVDPSQPKGRDRVLIPTPGATVWARFYDIDTNEPFFSGRAGIKKKKVTEIEVERRTGYGWYGTWAQDLIAKEYPKWRSKLQGGKA